MGLRKYHIAPTCKCENCGETFARKQKFNGHSWAYVRPTKFCGYSCSSQFRWKNAKGFIDKHGYRVVYNCLGKQIPEHRLVMQNHIGRELTKQETVHHKNGNRLDNSLDNLELWSSRHGRGQRVEDKIDFCRSFLNEYNINHTAMNPSDYIGGQLAVF